MPGTSQPPCTTSTCWGSPPRHTSGESMARKSRETPMGIPIHRLSTRRARPFSPWRGRSNSTLTCASYVLSPFVVCSCWRRLADLQTWAVLRQVGLSLAGVHGRWVGTYGGSQAATLMSVGVVGETCRERRWAEQGAAAGRMPKCGWSQLGTDEFAYSAVPCGWELRKVRYTCACQWGDLSHTLDWYRASCMGWPSAAPLVCS